VDAALGTAAASIDQTYIAPTRHHNMIEPSATLAEWRGDELHVHDATQWTFGIRFALSAILGIEPDKIHVRCPFTGGGFGAKGYVWPHQILAPIAARIAGRPVKLVIGRANCYTGSGYQPIVQSRVQLGADAAGKLTAIVHETENVTSDFDDYVEFGSAGSRAMYNAGTYRFRTRIRRADVATPTAMRAPHEGPGMFAFESAMDELAYALNFDPLELRLRNHTDTDMMSGKPFSSKKLREAYAEGAKRIGWAERKMEPRSRREGGKLIGMGMASAIMSTFRFGATARVSLDISGNVLVEAGTQEIGTGTRTIFAQVAADRLGIPTDRVKVELGSTSRPQTGGTFGSSTKRIRKDHASPDACRNCCSARRGARAWRNRIGLLRSGTAGARPRRHGAERGPASGFPCDRRRPAELSGRFSLHGRLRPQGGSGPQRRGALPARPGLPDLSQSAPPVPGRAY
jgi:xanthine dehydrogenase YagR molybdenum-binding subunit